MQDSNQDTENLKDNPMQTQTESSDSAPVEEPIEERLAKAQQQAEEMKDAYLRAKAEAENIRRRSQEEINKAHKFAVESFARSMLSVKDSLEMALKVDAPTVESIKTGVEATLRQLSQVFNQNKIVEIVPEKEEKLDPMRHQTVGQEPCDQAPNTVVAVMQKGYSLSERLLRPASVIVSTPKKS